MLAQARDETDAASRFKAGVANISHDATPLKSSWAILT